ncbi:MAG TPA: hypothetical protein VFE47_18855 [Tepidisphaeraceae bacterium]|jgi:hypothetical protein|nr:hypothetical protein [Tepidisphaeraceae bacterium]
MPTTQHHLVALTAMLIACATTVQANVTVKRLPPEVQHKTFDPAKPPPEMPHLTGEEAAATTSVFRVQVGGDYEPISRKKGDDGWTTLIAVHGLTITLRLQVTIWVPQGVTEKLKAHEEGHRRISEMVYQDRAIKEAKAAGAMADGKRFSGEGKDWKTAAANAVNPVLDKLGKAYLHNTADVENEINNIYDELTRHGSNDKPEDEAIKEAFARYEKEHATTQPSK